MAKIGPISNQSRFRLSSRQQAFVNAYLLDPHGGRAAEAAGYSTPAVAACRLLKHPYIQHALGFAANQAAAIAPVDLPAIASRAERHAMWSAMARDTSLRPFERLKASELLAKAGGDFIERHEVTGPGGGPVQLGTVVVHELIAVEVKSTESGEE